MSASGDFSGAHSGAKFLELPYLLLLLLCCKMNLGNLIAGLLIAIIAIIAICAGLGWYSRR